MIISWLDFQAKRLIVDRFRLYINDNIPTQLVILARVERY